MWGGRRTVHSVACTEDATAQVAAGRATTHVDMGSDMQLTLDDFMNVRVLHWDFISMNNFDSYMYVITCDIVHGFTFNLMFHFWALG